MQAFRRYRAPAEEGGVLVEPSWDAQLRLIDSCQAHRAAVPLVWAGHSLASLAAELRLQTVNAAARWTGVADRAFDETTPLVVSGHQPELFHPGVLIKNVALDRLARAVGGVGLHLVIDSDLCREVAINVPTGTLEAPRRVALAYDQPAPEQPYEQRPVMDHRVFASFPQRITEALAPFIANPEALRVWPAAREALESTGKISAGLNAARRVLQRDWDDRTLELPISAVADTIPFRAFLFELVSRSAETRVAYNAALATYRQAHRLRSAAQPLPDLAAGADGWVETPFWITTPAASPRRPLWARNRAGAVEIANFAGWNATLPSAPEDAIRALTQLREEGVLLRSRALTTTLFTRWALADLFLHGIGGAKYDQVTDRISHQLFGQAPPPHATLSATLRLPIPHPACPITVAQAVRDQRDLRYHPERFMSTASVSGEALRWIEEKRAAIALAKSPANAAERHRRIVRANQALAEYVSTERAAMREQLTAARLAEQSRAILGSREHAFVLFPQGWLAPRLADAVPLPAG
ncbi:hypothetical protein [Botrimarina hoheduenensis]|uniref:Uncharacterized protein n=1 Tax=Botrimarina hoheduenensis TaxID=2528000 RepID=A0A5C5W720_9BACT|nr:hypothetical protein [Botrimarina hoheduenensis]TWT46658.1 hypothetical protein Pla111_17590 [Botrimarina hoheduenensis]